MLRQRGEFVPRVRHRLAVQGGFQQAVRDQVGEAAVGGGGVGVIFDRQPEMARRLVARKIGGVFARAQQLDDGQRQIGEAQRIGLPRLGQEGFQRLRIGRVGQRRPVLRGDLDDPLPAFGRAHHAPDRRELLRHEKLRHRAVGRDHEILDDLFRAVLLIDFQIAQLLAVEDRPGLQRFQAERAMLVAVFVQFLGGRVLQAQILRQAGDRGDRFRRLSLAVQPRGHAAVGQLGVVVDGGLVDLGGLDRAVRTDHQLDHQCQPVFGEIQRGEPGRELFGQHGEDARRRVDRGRVIGGALVQRRSPADQCVYVRHRNVHFHALAGQGFRDGELIQVFGVVVVDGAPDQLPQIAARSVRDGGGGLDAIQLDARGGGNVGQQPAVEHGLPGNTLQNHAVGLVLGTHQPILVQ